MKKLFLLSSLFFFSFLLIKANDLNSVPAYGTNAKVAKPPFKVTICIGYKIFTICKDINIECHRVKGGFSCSITSARLVAENYDPKNNRLEFDVPEDWNGIEAITLEEDTYLETEKGEKSPFVLKAGRYVLTENKIVISTSE